MIFLQAMPDDIATSEEVYLYWQLLVQILNFREKGVEDKMVVLLSYPKGGKPSKEYQEIQTWFKGKIYFYEDTRERKTYLSSIRPHLIKKYLAEHPTEVFFYHDQDIIFLSPPDLDKFDNDDFCYTAEQAKGYVYTKYLKNFPGPDKQGNSRDKYIFPGMCNIIGVDPNLVEENDENCGGGQYIIRGTDYKFWDKVERDCEDLYSWLFKETRSDASQGIYHVQIWAADMWALFFNLLLANKKVRLLKDIDFTWPYDTFDNAKAKGYNIMHNAGIDHTNDHEKLFDVVSEGQILARGIPREQFVQQSGKNYEFLEVSRKKRYFYKGNYRKKTPFHEGHDYLKNDMLQTKYVSYFKLLKDNKPMEKKKILVLWNSTYGRPEKPIHPELIAKSLDCVKKAAERTTMADIEVVTTAWKEVPNNPFKQYVTPFKNLGHLNYLLQLKQQALNHTGDIVAIIEHDALIPDTYFDEIMINWDYGKYGLNNRNYMGVNVTGYLNVIERHHPFSAMSFAKFYFDSLLNTKIDVCIKNIGDWGGAAIYGWCCVEPDNKGEMSEFWATKPMLHISPKGLGVYDHSFTTHDIVCYERDSKGKHNHVDWGNYLDLLPFMKEYIT